MPDVELERWHGEDAAAWRELWRLPALRLFSTVGSTNDIAAEVAVAGAPEGAVVLADEQTRGRGRRGRGWTSAPGASLSMSMVLRPRTSEAAALLTLRLGLAAARALEIAAPLQVGLKWPNDLELDGRKVGGILCEAASAPGRLDYVVAGIGLNLRPPGDGWPTDIADRATSLEENAASTVNAPAVVAELVRQWLDVATHTATTLSQEELAAFQARDTLRGREVALDDRAAGVACGITAHGALRVHQDGRVIDVTAATVRALDPLTGRPT